MDVISRAHLVWTGTVRALKSEMVIDIEISLDNLLRVFAVLGYFADKVGSGLPATNLIHATYQKSEYLNYTA